MVFICIPISHFYVFIYIRLVSSVSASLSTSHINQMINYVKYLHFKFCKPQCLQTTTVHLNFKILCIVLLVCYPSHYKRALISLSTRYN